MKFINLTMSFGTQELFSNINLYIAPNEKVGIVGVNGAGKTTFFKIILGIIEPDEGKIILENNERVGYLPQIINDEISNLDISAYEFLSSARPIEKLNNHLIDIYNEIAVSEELTPTLYKLVHNGFYFTNYYTPTIDSTIGGEFQELTGLYPGNGFLANWKSGTNYFPYGIGTSFQNLGYNTYAYHDHDYTFQNRNKYLESLGFNNFEACGNGLEAKVNCHVWPESDLEMIKGTVSDYASSDKPFMVYYATVSGHGDYTWTTQSSKHKDEVNNLNYSSKVLAYLAANIELNNALEELINELQENGKLDDTVIVLTGDHYPYFLSADEVNEVSSYYKDSTVEINHSNLIIWNNKMTSKEINKVGSEIDVLPTVYNLFNVPYDSRIRIGKDILSNEPGLAMFGNRSWVSDLGTFYAGSNTFIAKENVIIPDDYLKIMNEKVNNKINMSGLIMKTNYYRQITEK